MLNDNHSHCQFIQEKAASSTSSSLSRPSSIPDKFTNPQAWLQYLQDKLQLFDADIEVERQNLLRSHPDLASKCENPPLLLGGFSLQSKIANSSKGLEIVGFDWLSFSLPLGRKPEYDLLHQHYFPGDIPTLTSGKNRHVSGEAYDSGVFVSWTSSGEGQSNMRDKMFVSLSGKPLGLLSAKSQLDYSRDVMTLGAKSTRTDLKVRDFRKIAPASRIQELCETVPEKGPILTHYSKTHAISNPTKVGVKAVTDGYYLGTRQSPTQVCIYDENHKHSLDSIAYEVRFRKEKAHLVVMSIMDEYCKNGSVEDTFQHMASLVRGSMTLVDRTDTNTSRCKPHPILDEIFGDIESARIRVHKEPSTLESTRRYLYQDLLNTKLMLLCDSEGITVEELSEKGAEAIIEVHYDAFAQKEKDRLLKAELKSGHRSKLRANRKLKQSSGPFHRLWQAA